MTWVRGHYRRPSRRYRASALDGLLTLTVLAMFGVGMIGYGLMIVISAVVSAGEGVAASMSAHSTLLLGLFGVGSVAYALALIYRIRRYFRRRAFLQAARSFARGKGSSEEEVARLREHLGRALSPPMAHELEEHYRGLVAAVVEDHRVRPDELERLRSLERAFGLSAESVTRARLEGFLAVYDAVIADRVLTEEEERDLAQVREALGVDAAAIGAQLAFVDQLRAARKVADGLAPTVDTPIKLSKGEECYFAAPASECALRTSRSYVRDGVRHKETTIAPVRKGDLYVTNRRVLFVSGGVSTTKLERIMDVAVDPATNLLSLVKDGRTAPLLYEVPTPFLALAHIDRVRAPRNPSEPR